MRLIKAVVRSSLLFCVLPAGAQSFQLQPTQIVGIDLIGPDSSEFNPLLEKLVPYADSRVMLRPALGLSFVVRNTTRRPIRTITVRFEYTSRSTLRPVSGIISQEYEGLTDGAFDLFLPSGSIAKLKGAKPNQASLLHVSEFQSSPVVKASLDSVIYSDGQFVGPDLANNFPRLSRESAQFNLLVQELRAMEGLPIETLRTRLQQISQEPREKMGKLRLWTRSVTARSLLGVLDHSGRDQMQKVLSDMVKNPPTPAVHK